MSSRFYLIHYTSDETALQRRRQKILASGCDKVLFSEEWLKEQTNLTKMAKELLPYGKKLALSLPHHCLLDLRNSEVESILSFFDEIVLAFDTTETVISGHLEHLFKAREKVYGLVYFEKKFSEVLFLSRLPVWLRERLYFHPSSKHLSGQIIYETGQRVQSHFPEIHFQPLPGLDQWDHRIPEDVELLVHGDLYVHHRTPTQDIKLSVIIPTYDNADYLLNCVRHLLKQTLPRQQYEILVVDDGTPNKDFTELESFLAPIAEKVNFKYFYAPKKIRPNADFGQFRAGLCRNFGVTQAQGSILSFLDSDMIVPENYLEKVISRMETTDMLQFVRHHIRPASSDRFTNYNEVPAKKLFVEESRYWKPFFDCHSWMDMPDFWKYTCTYSLSMRKENFEKWGGFRKTYVSYGFEDTDFGYRAAQTGARFHLETTPLYHLTPFADKARYRHSMLYKHRLLKLTAKTFYLNHLSPDIYQKFKVFLDR